MNALLICPSDRPQVSGLAEFEPLCAVALAGRSLLEYWLTILALERVKHVLVVTDDRRNRSRASPRMGCLGG